MAHPDLSGFRLLVNLIPRPRHPDVAVIMLTRYDLPSLAALACDHGAHAYLVKSRCSGDKLHMAIHKAIATVGPTNKEPRQSDR